LVIDASRPLETEDHELLRRFMDARCLVVLNKRDLGLVTREDEVLANGAAAAVSLSALTGEGVEDLRRLIHETALSICTRPAEFGSLTTVRQKEAAQRALTRVTDALDGYHA